MYMYIRFVAAINYLYDDDFTDLWLQVPVELIAILIQYLKVANGLINSMQRNTFIKL